MTIEFLAGNREGPGFELGRVSAVVLLELLVLISVIIHQKLFFDAARSFKFGSVDFLQNNKEKVVDYLSICLCPCP